MRCFKLASCAVVSTLIALGCPDQTRLETPTDGGNVTLDAANIDAALGDAAGRDLWSPPTDAAGRDLWSPPTDAAGRDHRAPPLDAAGTDLTGRDTNVGPGQDAAATDRWQPGRDRNNPPADAATGSDRFAPPVDAGTLRCGDGRCLYGLEDCATCPQDCGVCRNNCDVGDRCNGQKNCLNCPGACGQCPAPVCGDGDCNGLEVCDSCVADCGVCPFCGDTMCNGSEDCNSCNQDCGACPFCGDTRCNGSENCATCEQDCNVCPPATCGDLVCDVAESQVMCPSDCGQIPATCAANGTCDGNAGETCTDCGADCNVNDVIAVCGNGECESGEAWNTCAGDCGPNNWPALWQQWEAEVVTVMNQHRAAGTDCPSGAKEPVGALTMDPLLQRAAELHAWDMAYSGYFAHTSCNGRTPWARASAQGTSANGENIAWGYGSPTDVVSNGWMTSTSGHCDAIMNGGYSAVGIGYASGNMWVAMFR